MQHMDRRRTPRGKWSRKMSRARPFVVSAFLALTVGAGGALGFAPPKILSFGPDLIIILVKPPVQDKKTGVLEGVELQGETVTETAAEANGWRSMRAILDVSCAERRDRVRSMTVFNEHNGGGAATALIPPADWITPDQNTAYGLAAVKYFCRDGGGVRLANRASSPKSSSAETPAEEVPLAPSGPSAPGIAPGIDPGNANVPSTSFAAPAPEQVQAAVDRPSAAATTPPSPAAPSKPSVEPTRTSASGPFAVQVGSATVQAEANAILDHLKSTRGALFAGLQTRIEAADVRGQRHYRALVVGFPDPTTAGRFCAALHDPNGCIVRRAP
jgi:cell division septation protein DedD